jgi:putative Mg2+ transporter-C (MgtC) family protein
LLKIEWITETTPTEAVHLLLAFVLASIVGLERQRKLKSAGLRTHALVGLGAALFTLVSAYGFSGVVGADVVLDPSRIAAQIVSGIGFLGAGVIFVRQNAVSGLTTAASIWVTASIGMACGAGAPVLAIMGTALHLLAVWALGFLGKYVRQQSTNNVLLVRYREGNGALRNTLALAAEHGFSALVTESREISKPGKSPKYQATISLSSSQLRPATRLVEALTDIPGVTSVEVAQPDNE